MPTRRYITNTEGADLIGIRLGLSWLIRESAASGGTEAWLVVPAKETLRHGSIEQAIGQQAVKALLNNRPVPLQGGARLRLATERTLPATHPSGTILAAYPTRSLLDRLDTLPDVSALAVVPWTREEVQPWVDTWGPSAIASGTPVAAPRDISNRVVKIALGRLTSAVNLSTGIGHGSDHDKAVYLFRELRDAGESIDFDEVRPWLIRKGWQPDDADEVVRVGRLIIQGKRVPTHGDDPWLPDILDQWRQEASQATGSD